MRKTLVLGAVALALSAGAASAQGVNYVYPYSGYAPYGYGYAPTAPLYDYAAPAYGYAAPVYSYGAPVYGYAAPKKVANWSAVGPAATVVSPRSDPGLFSTLDYSLLVF